MAKNELDFWRRGSSGMSQWDPFREMRSLQRSIDRAFEGFFDEPGRDLMQFQPTVDVDENDSQYLMTFDLPGIREEDIRIELRDGNQLIVSGERKEEQKEDKNRRWRERSYGMFQRLFTLPPNVDPDRIQAGYENGELKLTIPKTQAVQPKQIPVGRKQGGQQQQKKTA